MDKKKVSKIILIILSICLAITAISSVTYALFSNDVYAPNPDAYSTGILSIETTSKTEKISITNALPMTDEEGKASTPYVFTIKNNGNLDYEFDVKLVPTNDNYPSLEYVKFEVNNHLTGNLYIFPNGEILSDIILPAGESIDISIKMWLSIATPNSEIGKGFECKIVTDGYAVVDKRPNTLMSGSDGTKKFLRSDLNKDQIASVIFTDSNVVPNTAIASYDVSYSMDGTVMMWYGEANNNGLYDVYIGSSNGTTIISNGNSLFYKLTEVTSINLANIDTSEVTDMYIMFSGCSKLATLDLSNFSTEKVTTMQGMFYNCKSLTELDLSNFDTSNVKSMYYMFGYCENLNSLTIDNFNTEKVTGMNSMFAGCVSLKSLDLSKWNVSNVTKMNEMFASYSSVGGPMALTSIGNVSNWDTSNVTDMSGMFQLCNNLKIDVSNWKVSKVENMRSMFYGCRSIENMDLSKWDTSNVTTVRAMFEYCDNLKVVDLSNWNITNLKETKGMFQYCQNLTTIYASDWKKTDIDSTKMFDRCTSLVGGAGTIYNASHVDLNYAIIDGGTSNPGYFTLKV